MWIWFVLGFVVLLFFICLVASVYAIDSASRRAPSGVLISPVDVKTMARYAYREELQQGAKWLSAQPMETITVQSRDGLTLHGRLLRKEAARGLILAFHGYHSFAEKDFGCIAPDLADAGYSILFIDQRAHEKSEGEIVSYGVKERFDCLEWADAMAARTGGELPMYLYGQSMGASTILMASGLVLPASVKGIVADCGFTSPAAEMGYTLRHKYHLPALLFLPLMGLAAIVRKGYGIWSADTRKALRKNRIPVLLFHGKKDMIVPYVMSVQNDAAAVAQHLFCSMDGAAHCTCFFHDRKLYLETMLTFLSEHV